MPTPKTYLMTAPIDADDAFGTMLHSNDLVRGLRKANPRLHVPHPTAMPLDWGMTSLWLGRPFGRESTKICAFDAGPIPEWTQVAPDGTIIKRGWRSILEATWKRHGASKASLERVFRVSLGAEGSDGSCDSCRKMGRPVQRGGVCTMHRNVSRNANAAARNKVDAPLRERSLASHAARNPVSVNIQTP